MREELLKAVKILEEGGTILYPTDTIWGIGCDATNYKAVEKVFAIKRRQTVKSYIILLDQPEKLLKYVERVPDIAWDLISSVESPLTVVYPRAKNLAKNVVAADGSIAIRIIKDVFCQQLINLFNKPIVSTSANVAGEAAPLMFSKVSKEIINKVDYVVNVNRDKLNKLKPSTIIKINENGEYVVLRS
ncbi:MAG: L-threonylcarbamoyladenylate synthase [Bacteroidetes bacterium]|nr:L-threonylcarbamoyladenylate synthase [Bacteroidota bacterium]